jgi:hypothetical protein
LQPWSSSQTLTENIAKCDESVFRLRLIEVKKSDLPFQEALLLNIIQYFLKRFSFLKASKKEYIGQYLSFTAFFALLHA